MAAPGSARRNDAGGNHDLIDLAPARGGKVGQIISAHRDDGARTLEGADFLGWLQARLRAAVKGA